MKLDPFVVLLIISNYSLHCAYQFCIHPQVSGPCASFSVGKGLSDAGPVAPPPVGAAISPARTPGLIISLPFQS
jgi:hypothetical protein